MGIINNLLNIVLILTYVLLNSVGALLIKSKINKVGHVPLTSTWNFFYYFLRLLKTPEVLIGFSIIFLSSFAWMAALSRLDISIAYPLAIGLNFIVVVGTGVVLFSEPLHINKIIGIALILLSTYFLSK